MGESDRTRNILVGAAVIIIIVLVVVFVLRSRQSNDLITVNSPLPTPFASFEQNLQNDFGIVVPSSAKKAELTDITGHNQMGLATLDMVSGKNEYTVIANLEDPAAGYFYQAWLVNGTNYISLGKLALAKGGWLVSYNTISDLTDHKKVWVTVEKLFDNIPETSILVGSF